MVNLAIFTAYLQLNLNDDPCYRNFCKEEVLINTDEVISFEPLSERDARGNYLPCVKLTLKSGRELILANRMQDIKERFGFKTSSI
mgnify:CR=1 FL=1